MATTDIVTIATRPRLERRPLRKILARPETGAFVAALAVPLVVRWPDLVVVGLAGSLAAGPHSLGPVEVVQLATFLAAAAVLGPAALRGDVRLPTWPVLVPMAALVVLAVVSSAAAPVPSLAFNLIVQLVLLVLMTVTRTPCFCTASTSRRKSPSPEISTMWVACRLISMTSTVISTSMLPLNLRRPVDWVNSFNGLVTMV